MASYAALAVHTYAPVSVSPKTAGTSDTTIFALLIVTWQTAMAMRTITALPDHLLEANSSMAILSSVSPAETLSRIIPSPA